MLVRVADLYGCKGSAWWPQSSPFFFIASSEVVLSPVENPSYYKKKFAVCTLLRRVRAVSVYMIKLKRARGFEDNLRYLREGKFDRPSGQG